MSEHLGRYVVRDGAPHYAGRPMTAVEAMDENRPLPRLALYVLGWTDAQIDAAVGAEPEYPGRGRSES